MAVFLHELKRGKTSLIIWSCAISFMLGICIFLYPEMKSQMQEIGDMFADMGSFSSAFGMDQINYGTLIGYFGIECGNVLGLGGAIFAGILGAGALAKEEKEHTAEFLLSHPISRNRVLSEKLLAVFSQVILLNLAAVLVSVISILAIGETVDKKALSLLFLAYFLMQIIIAAITFGISAFLKGSGMGIGIGFALLTYILNIISNLSNSVNFLKYFTPFSFTEGADIITNGAINFKYLLIAAAFAIVFVAGGFIKYQKKDIS